MSTELIRYWYCSTSPSDDSGWMFSLLSTGQTKESEVTSPLVNPCLSSECTDDTTQLLAVGIHSSTSCQVYERGWLPQHDRGCLHFNLNQSAQSPKTNSRLLTNEPNAKTQQSCSHYLPPPSSPLSFAPQHQPGHQTHRSQSALKWPPSHRYKYHQQLACPMENVSMHG